MKTGGSVISIGSRTNLRLGLFVWLFVTLETLFFFHSSSLSSLPRPVDPLYHNVQTYSESKQLSISEDNSPCDEFASQPKNRLICSTLHSLWESFSPPKNQTADAVNRVVPNIIQRPSTRKTGAIVLATHLGVQKLETLVIQSRWWGGPISAAIYLKSADEIKIFLRFVKEHEFNFRYISFHVVLEKTELPYPHNILRNLALDYLDGEFFVAADVDFIPTPDSHRKLVQLFYDNKRLRQKLISKTVMVLAAFERHMPNPSQEVTEDMLPKTKHEVIEMVKSRKGNGFHMAGSSAGHGPTDFKKWLENKTDVFYGIPYKNIFEPYILGYKPGIPRYWQDFRGYGYNKFSWFFEINKAGYEFAVLRDFYVVHMNHPIPDMKKKNALTDSNRRHWQNFKGYLARQYKKPAKPA